VDVTAPFRLQPTLAADWKGRFVNKQCLTVALARLCYESDGACKLYWQLTGRFVYSAGLWLLPGFALVGQSYLLSHRPYF